MHEFWLLRFLDKVIDTKIRAVRVGKRKERRPFHGKLEDISGFKTESNEYRNIILLIDGIEYTIWPPFGEVLTEEDLTESKISNEMTLDDLKVGQTVQGIYYIDEYGNRRISWKDLDKFEIVEKVEEPEEGSDSSSQFKGGRA